VEIVLGTSYPGGSSAGGSCRGDCIPDTPARLVVYAPVKQMFCTWMKTFGQTKVNEMRYEPMYSAQAQSVRTTE